MKHDNYNIIRQALIDAKKADDNNDEITRETYLDEAWTKARIERDWVKSDNELWRAWGRFCNNILESRIAPALEFIEFRIQQRIQFVA